MSIGTGRKFCAVCARQVGSTDGFTAFEILSGVVVSSRAPFTVGAPWDKWVGSDLRDAVTEGNLFVTAWADSSTPMILDVESAELRKRVTVGWLSLLTIGVPKLTRVLMVTGGINKDETDVRQVGRIDVATPPDLAYGATIDLNHLKRAARVAAGLEKINTDLAGYRKLRRGVKALRAALHDADGGERIHQAVKAIEAVIGAERGETRRRFKSRTELFVGPNQHLTTEHLFDIRSDVEHMNDPDLNVPHVRAGNAAELAAIRGLQAEVLATYVYERILSTPELLTHFESSDAIAAFWALEPEERQSLWGPRLDWESRVRSDLALDINIKEEIKAEFNSA